jgi:hypothetical protein
VTDGILREVAESCPESEFAVKLGPPLRGRASRRKSFTPIILQNVHLFRLRHFQWLEELLNITASQIAALLRLY